MKGSLKSALLAVLCLLGTLVPIHVFAGDGPYCGDLIQTALVPDPNHPGYFYQMSYGTVPPISIPIASYSTYINNALTGNPLTTASIPLCIANTKGSGANKWITDLSGSSAGVVWVTPTVQDPSTPANIPPNVYPYSTAFRINYNGMIGSPNYLIGSFMLCPCLAYQVNNQCITPYTLIPLGTSSGLPLNSDGPAPGMCAMQVNQPNPTGYNSGAVIFQIWAPEGVIPPVGTYNTTFSIQASTTY